ncbi:hypothetical protein ACFQXA_01425 [Nocardiopsis composta]
MDRRTARGNRIGLALLGLASAAIGGAGLAAGYGAWGPGPDGRVLPAGLAGAAGPWAPYLPYAGAALALLAALAALGWILGQARTGAIARTALEETGAGAVAVSASALQEAVRGRAGGYPGCARCGCARRAPPTPRGSGSTWPWRTTPTRRSSAAGCARRPCPNCAPPWAPTASPRSSA